MSRGDLGDAICLADPRRAIVLGTRECIHDGWVKEGYIYFTSVDGHLYVVSEDTLKVEEELDLNTLGGDSPPGFSWCRGVLPVEGGRAWVCFTRIRQTRWKEKVRWIKNMVSAVSRPTTRLALYDLGRRERLQEINLEAMGMHAVFNAVPAPADGRRRSKSPPRTVRPRHGMIDLHTHSTASDGSLAPAALLDRAAARGVTGLALTDHDTLAGLAEARGRAEAHGIAFLAGIELSTGWRGLDEVHLLGYGVDGAGSGGLAAACGGLRAGRARRAERMVGRLQAAGVGLRLEAVLAEAAGGAVGRPHVARALLAGGWASDMAEAFRRWLVPGTPGYVAQERLETVEGMRLIRAAGGVAVLAHPGTLP